MTKDPIDTHVGARIRALRKQLRLSQSDLAKWLGLTFQQVQKYENGHNRVSASMLAKTARFLEVSPAYFFDGVEDMPENRGPISPFLSMAAERTGLEMAELWPGLTPGQKRTLVDLAGAFTTAPKPAKVTAKPVAPGARPRGRPKLRQA